MKFTSHLLLADYLHQHLFEETGLKLDKKSFKYGHVKPDIRRSYFGVKHYYQEAQIIVDTLIDRVENEHMDLYHFSEVLGVIGHFVTDYFCLYHHDRNLYNGSKIKHFLYENKLHKCMKAYLSKDEQVSFDMDYSDVRDVIRYARDQYKKAHGSPIIDAAYALAVTSEISKALIHAYILNNRTITIATTISREVLTPDMVGGQMA